jgi:hypothetical protein
VSSRSTTVLGVTSLVGGAGRTTISRGIAASLARLGVQVAWLGADVAGGGLRGVDRSLRATLEHGLDASVGGAVICVGAEDDDEARWALTQDEATWSRVVEVIATVSEVVVLDTPCGVAAEHVVRHCSNVLGLVPLDRPPAPSLEALAEMVRRARPLRGTTLDGLALTRFDESRRGSLRSAETIFGLAPARAWIGPIVPEGAGAAREGAIDALARAWLERAGLVELSERGELGAVSLSRPREARA